MKLQRGDIILVKYPFTDFTCSKLRPALVISTDDFNRQGGDIICVCISSQDPKASDDVVIAIDDKAFPATQLKQQSTVISSKVMTVDRNIVRRRLGYLDSTLLGTVSGRIKVVMGLR